MSKTKDARAALVRLKVLAELQSREPRIHPAGKLAEEIEGSIEIIEAACWPARKQLA